MKQKRAFLYIRVSTDEQADKGYSLKHQEERLRSYCQFQNIEVVGLYKDDHSAKTFERPAFKQLLAFLKKNKKSADLLLFTKWDRFSRNAADAYAMINTLNCCGVEPQAIEQPLDLSIPENKIMLAFYLAAPEVENDRRALNVIVGMRRAKKEGRWMATAPKGYKNVRIDNRPTIIPTDDAKYIKWIYEEINKRVLAPDQVRKAVNKKGFTVSRGYFWTMIRNPIYCGKIFIPAYKGEEAHFVTSVHPALVSEELFNSVQDILNGKKIDRSDTNKHRDELPLRGFLACSRCGGRLTGSASKGKYERYFYYHCQPGCKERHPANLANDELIPEFRKISVTKESLQLYQMILEKELKKSGSDNSEEKKKINSEIQKHQERIDKAEQLMLDGQLEMSEYKAIKEKYEKAIKDLQTALTPAHQKCTDYKKYLDFGINLLANLDGVYVSAKTEVKNQILSSILAEKLVFDGKKYRTPIYHEVLAMILNDSKALRRNKKGQNQKSMTLSSGVVPTGIEPVSKV
jgi:site-specific DNA recombinase